jgi:hypothetical protein
MRKLFQQAILSAVSFALIFVASNANGKKTRNGALRLPAKPSRSDSKQAIVLATRPSLTPHERLLIDLEKLRHLADRQNLIS